MTGMLTEEATLDRIFSALAHPIRRQVLLNLKGGKATVSELAEPFEVSLPAITKHLKVLEDADLISRTKEAQRRYSQLDPKPLKIASDWLNSYKEYWIEHFDRLQGYIDHIQRDDENEQREK